MIRRARRLLTLVAFVSLVVLGGAAGHAEAQDASATPAFSLATSHVFNTKERPSISLTHRGVDHLDFRVYRVNDTFTFFEKLRDAHELGSEDPIVPQEQTWLERIASWKASRRGEAKSFLRRQFSPAYRRARAAQSDQQEVVLRRTLNVNSFAQVPLLNSNQLVTSWRELLPPVRDAEYRRVPLEISQPGIYVVEAVSPPLRAYTVVMMSDVGLVTKTAPGQLLVFAANRFTGAPIDGCRIRVLADQTPVGNGTTSADGTFVTDVTLGEPDSLVTVADCAGQAAATDPGAFTVRSPSRELAGYIYTDRPVYRPGHTMHYRSVLRWRDHGSLAPFGNTPVEVSVVDGDEKVLLRERKTPDEFGAVSGSLTLPQSASLGYYVVRVDSGDHSATGSFEVQEYRKPEFDVAVRPTARFVRQGGNATATVSARYYFGQPVSGGQVKFVLHRQSYYSALRFESFDGEEDNDDFYFGGGDAEFEGTARLDEAGNAQISVPFELDERGRDYTGRIEATVMDASGREVTGASSSVATYGRFMVMATVGRYVYSAGEAMAVRARAVDYAGSAQANLRIHAAIEQLDYSSGYDNPKVTVIQQGDVTTDADGRAAWAPTAPRQPGSYRVHVTARSDDREVSDDAHIWIPGAQEQVEDDSDRILELIADKRSYQPGDTARLVIQGESFDASILITKESQLVSYHQVVRTAGGSAIDVPIAADDIGDTYVSVAFLKDDRLFRAERRLSVPATGRALTITAEADKAVVRPGEPGVFTLRVTDASGAPARAQLSIGLVDEALYGVRPDTTPDPLRFFYRREYNEVSTSFSRFYPFVGYSGTEQLELAQRRRPLTLADFKADRPDRPRVRKDFPDTVYWSANVVTDSSGVARIKVDYPDSLTTWRLTARAITTSTHVGTATAHTTTTKDLILRVITPRFLTEGDKVTMPSIVHNYLAEPKTVALTMTAEGLATEASPTQPPRSLQVAPNGLVRSDWQFSANSVRNVTVTGKATTDVAGDAVALTFPVIPAGLERAAGTSGSLSTDASRDLQFTIPPSANPSARSVRVALAPSLAGGMLGALDYLTSYPWGCTEQTLSSFVPNLVVLRAMTDLGLTPTERLQSLDRKVSDGLKRLYDYQHDDGGWGWWKTDQNHPFMTAYAVDGLIQARDAGARIEVYRISTGAEALARLWAEYPRAIPDLKAYEAYVLVRAQHEGFPVVAALDELWSARSRMTATGQAFLLMTLDARQDARAETLTRELLASARNQGVLTSWSAESDVLLEDFADTSVEATALTLKALSDRGTSDPALERAARWLMANRTGGSFWVSTKQTALALQGLLAFMRARNERALPVTADVFVNGAKAGTARFDTAALTAPNPIVIEVPANEGANTVRIVRQGEGAIYFDAGVHYYDKPAAAERTGTRRLALLREYALLTPVEAKGRIVYRESNVPATVNAGDMLVVRLTVAGSADWRFLQLIDPIPAGTEAIEREEPFELEKPREWTYGSQRELRDNRTVYFFERLDEGRREFSYLLKVTTPGTFNAMPAHVAPMYVPDVSASSDAMTLTVTPEGVR